MQNRHFQPSQLRGVDHDKRTVDIVASDGSLDSYYTRIDPNGWELKQYKNNPVICLQHDSYNGLPVATALPDSVRVEGGKLVMTVQFPPKGTSERSDEAFGLIAAGILRGVSVGFDPVEHKDADEIVDGRKMSVRTFTKQSLREVSFVTIPSNNNGLVVRSRDMGHDPEEMRKITERLESRLKEDSEPDELGKYTRDHLVKCVGYFENKQPANRASTKVLEKFFKARGEEQPADEVEAWNRMSVLMDETPEEQPVIRATADATPEIETTPTPSAVSVTIDTTPPEAAPTTEPTPPVQEAPAPERKASVQIPISLLAKLPGTLARARTEAAAEALRNGVPRKVVAKSLSGSI